MENTNVVQKMLSPNGASYVGWLLKQLPANMYKATFYYSVFAGRHVYNTKQHRLNIVNNT